MKLTIKAKNETLQQILKNAFAPKFDKMLDGIHPHDIGTILNQDGIAVRTGHHCAQPVMQRFNVPATSRASFAFYNKKTEVDALVASIKNVQKVFL